MLKKLTSKQHPSNVQISQPNRINFFVEGHSPEIKRKYLSSLEVRKSLSKNEIPDSAAQEVMQSLGEKLLMKLNKQRNKFFRRQIDHLNQ